MQQFELFSAEMAFTYDLYEHAVLIRDEIQQGRDLFQVATNCDEIARFSTA